MKNIHVEKKAIALSVLAALIEKNREGVSLFESL